MNRDELLRKFLDDCRLRDVRDSTIEWYEWRLRKFLAAMPDDLAAWTPLAVLDYIKSIEASELTRKGHWRAVKRLLRWAEAEDLIQPIAKKIRLKFDKPAPRPIMDQSDLLNLIDSVAGNTIVSRRNHAIFSMLYFVGSRAGEVLGLKRSDLDLAAGVVKIYHQKTRKFSILPLVKPLRVRLNSYLEWHPGGEWLFPAVKSGGARWNPETQPEDRPVALQTITIDWRRHQTAVGIQKPARLHDLRHFCASHLLNAGVSLDIIKELLGHSSTAVTQIYAQLSTERLACEIERGFGSIVGAEDSDIDAGEGETLGDLTADELFILLLEGIDKQMDHEALMTRLAWALEKIGKGFLCQVWADLQDRLEGRSDAMKCSFCDSEFVPIEEGSKWCSDACRESARKAYIEEYRRKNKDRIAKRDKEYRQKHRDERARYMHDYRARSNDNVNNDRESLLSH